MSAHEGPGGGGPRLGAMFGRYRIDGVVARGGTGLVFRATDTELGRAVALKLLAGEPDPAPPRKAGFLDEARLAASLDHPAIVPVYEAGVIDGIPFIAMRLVPGMDLAHLLRAAAPLTLAGTLRILGPIAAALDTAHLHGLVHGDVKPGNVLVKSAADGRVYLADFGLTWQVDTGTWIQRAGTLEYMAPELLSGGAVDGRADQYALGCLVVHCLVGHPPFEPGSDAQLVEAHLSQEPPSVEARMAGECPGLDAVLSRAMAKRPADRFPDCAAFVAALAALSPHPDVSVTPGSEGVLQGGERAGSDAQGTATRVPAAEGALIATAPPVVRRRRSVRLGDRRTLATVVVAVIALAFVIGSVGVMGPGPAPSVAPLPSGVTAEQLEWERVRIRAAERAAVGAGWQRCDPKLIKGFDRSCPPRSLDCVPQRTGPSFDEGSAQAGLKCRFSSDQVIVNAFVWDFPDADARDRWFASELLYISDPRGDADACAAGEPGHGPWVRGSLTGRLACWLYPTSGDVPRWWLSWYQDSTTRLGLLSGQPLEGRPSPGSPSPMTALLAAWRELPPPLGVGEVLLVPASSALVSPEAQDLASASG